MSKIRTSYLFVLVLIFASLLLSAAAPAPFSALEAASGDEADMVHLTVVNRSDKPIYIWMEGTAFYYLTVPADSTRTFTPLRGDYSYRIRACGLSSKETLDLSKNKTLIMPSCSGGRLSGLNSNQVDLNKQIKLVRVTIVNDTKTYGLLIMQGPGTYVFRFNPGEKKSFSIGRGEYDYTFYACSKVGKDSLYALSKSKFELSCPK